MPRDALEREGTSEAVPEAVGQAVGGGCQSGWEGGYCRLQMPLRPALGVRGTVAGLRLGALEGAGPPSNAPLPVPMPHALARLFIRALTLLPFLGWHTVQACAVHCLPVAVVLWLRGTVGAPGKVPAVTVPPPTARGHVSVWDLLTHGPGQWELGTSFSPSWVFFMLWAQHVTASLACCSWRV